MDTMYSKYIQGLDNEKVNARLDCLRKLKECIAKENYKEPVKDRGAKERDSFLDADENNQEFVKRGDINNHIHTFYSFSPYSPSKAVWMAYKSGLKTAGIMDHDSLAGAHEFIEAAKIIGIASTIGIECRADFSKTQLKGKFINNPDQQSIAYVALHGIPHTKIDRVDKFFESLRKERNLRNKKMINKINEVIRQFGMYIDFDEDVIPLSKSHEGGSITERHLLFALAGKIVERFSKGYPVIDFLENKLHIKISSSNRKYLEDKDNEFYEYDLLGALKGEFVAKFYINADKECPDVEDIVSLGSETGAVLAYAYLGDVENSVTGDKKAQKFEDDYIELLFEVLKELNFNAVTYMPSRNTLLQLQRVKSLCDKYNFFQISGEDINSPRQPFVCTKMRSSEFDNLWDSTWALIGHEKAATKKKESAMFSEDIVRRYPDINERIKVYKNIGLKNNNNK